MRLKGADDESSTVCFNKQHSITCLAAAWTVERYVKVGKGEDEKKEDRGREGEGACEKEGRAE